MLATTPFAPLAPPVPLPCPRPGHIVAAHDRDIRILVGLAVVGYAVGIAEAARLTSSRGFFRVGIAELPSERRVRIRKSLCDCVGSGTGAFFATGFATGAVMTGL